MARLELDLGGATDVGRVRSVNQDQLLWIGPDPERTGPASQDALIAVADGMGGHQAGEVASEIAIRSLEETFLSANEGASDTRPELLLRRAVRRANGAVWQEAGADAAREGMGTTLVCALLSDSGRVVIANVGDSRAYLVGRDEARLLTDDHSWVGEQVRAGRMTVADAERSPYRHVLSCSLGVMPDVEVDVYADVSLQPGEALVLCSDGVSAYVTTEDMVAVLRKAASAQEAAEVLVRLAVDRGGHDNATVVVARRGE